MRIAMFLTVAAALTLSAPVAAKSNQLAETKQSTATKSSDKKICKKVAATGSRMGERVCLTKEEWKKVQEQMNS